MSEDIIENPVKGGASKRSLGNLGVEVFQSGSQVWLEFNYKFVDLTPLFIEWAKSGIRRGR